MIFCSTNEIKDPLITDPRSWYFPSLEVGKLALTDFVPRRLSLHNYTLAALSEDDRLILGEIRNRVRALVSKEQKRWEPWNINIGSTVRLVLDCIDGRPCLSVILDVPCLPLITLVIC